MERMDPMKHGQAGFFGNAMLTGSRRLEGDTATIFYGASDHIVCCLQPSLLQEIHTTFRYAAL